MSLGVMPARGHKNQEAKKHPVDHKQAMMMMMMMMMMMKEMIRMTAQGMMMMTKML